MKKTISKSGSLYIQKSVRIGSKVSSRTVKKLGRIDELMKQFNMSREEVLAWADREIEKLEQLEKENPQKSVTITIPVTEAAQGKRPLKQTGYLFLQKVCYELGIDKICAEIAKSRQIHFDFPQIVLTMIYNRVLFPSSKRKCRLDSRFMVDPPVIAEQDTYRSLDILAENMTEILSSLYNNSNRVVKRNTEILYYDCTNFFMEIEHARGELSQYGVSKENRPNPIVQMGLFLDNDGIPFDMNINPGNQNETLSINKKTVSRIHRDFDVDHFIYCADAGLGSSAIRKAIQGVLKKNDFIITHSIKKMPEYLREWALDQSDQTWWFYRKPDSQGVMRTYKILFKDIDQSSENGIRYYRSRWAQTSDGREERYIVTYSPKYHNFQRQKRNEQIQRAHKKLEGQGIKKHKRANDGTRFIKETFITKEGEAAKKVVRETDYEKVAYEEQFDGFYCVATTLEWDEPRILSICAKRWKIEDCFRVMKTNFDARPVYLHRDDRIRAHFLICYMALMVFRILEKKLNRSCTSEELLKALRTMNYYDQFGQGYSYAYEPTELTGQLAQISGLELNKTFLTPARMKKVIRDSKKRKAVATNLS